MTASKTAAKKAAAKAPAKAPAAPRPRPKPTPAAAEVGEPIFGITYPHPVTGEPCDRATYVAAKEAQRRGEVLAALRDGTDLDED